MNGRIICELFYRNINKKNERNYPLIIFFVLKISTSCVKMNLIFVLVENFISGNFMLIINYLQNV